MLVCRTPIVVVAGRGQRRGLAELGEAKDSDYMVEILESGRGATANPAREVGAQLRAPPFPSGRNGHDQLARHHTGRDSSRGWKSHPRGDFRYNTGTDQPFRDYKLLT